MSHEPYSEEWWLRLDVRNTLRKTIERSKRDAEDNLPRYESVRELFEDNYYWNPTYEDRISGETEWEDEG